VGGGGGGEGGGGLDFEVMMSCHRMQNHKSDYINHFVVTISDVLFTVPKEVQNVSRFNAVRLQLKCDGTG